MKIGKHDGSKRAWLNIHDGFNEKQRQAFTPQERAFIRGIQISENKTRKEAIQEYNKYLTSTKGERKLRRAKVERAILDDSPQKKARN